jgi:hypothetical protein
MTPSKTKVKTDSPEKSSSVAMTEHARRPLTVAGDKNTNILLSKSRLDVLILKIFSPQMSKNR